ncbi:MAG: hypothetical protein LBD16_03120 [Oscillospiraceae bacterium]|jgi:hypothetical protein|nr:hypothetical protein [Oscillospiraceae bacterium]
MAEILEACMVVCFGLSWPVSILKSVKSRTAKGKSVTFSYFILVGYLCGIVSKLAAGRITYVFVFYIINLVAVSADVALYFRNRKLDAKA